MIIKNALLLIKQALESGTCLLLMNVISYKQRVRCAIQLCIKCIEIKGIRDGIE